MFDIFVFLTYATVGLGCIAGFCSACLACYFFRSTRPVARSVAWVLTAESIGMWITVLFSIGAGVFRTIGPWVEMGMRWGLFLTAMGSSLHMAHSIDRILREIDDR